MLRTRYLQESGKAALAAMSISSLFLVTNSLPPGRFLPVTDQAA